LHNLLSFKKPVKLPLPDKSVEIFPLKYGKYQMSLIEDGGPVIIGLVLQSLECALKMNGALLIG